MRSTASLQRRSTHPAESGLKGSGHLSGRDHVAPHQKARGKVREKQNYFHPFANPCWIDVAPSSADSRRSVGLPGRPPGFRSAARQPRKVPTSCEGAHPSRAPGGSLAESQATLRACRLDSGAEDGSRSKRDVRLARPPPANFRFFPSRTHAWPYFRIIGSVLRLSLGRQIADDFLQIAESFVDRRR